MVAIAVLWGASRARPARKNGVVSGTGRHGAALHLALAGFAFTIWGFVEIGCLRGTAGSNKYGSNPRAR
jgi:uncharacterized membrane protein YhaH (DUF805 family)